MPSAPGRERQPFPYATAERMTKWEELNACNRKVGNESCPVLELAIDHGIAPSGERYCYFFDTGSEEPSAIIGNPPFHILENSENAQVAESADGKVIQAVCYGKGRSFCQAVSMKSDLQSLRF